MYTLRASDAASGIAGDPPRLPPGPQSDRDERARAAPRRGQWAPSRLDGGQDLNRAPGRVRGGPSVHIMSNPAGGAAAGQVRAARARRAAAAGKCGRRGRRGRRAQVRPPRGASAAGGRVTRGPRPPRAGPPGASLAGRGAVRGARAAAIRRGAARPVAIRRSSSARDAPRSARSPRRLPGAVRGAPSGSERVRSGDEHLRPATMTRPAPDPAQPRPPRPGRRRSR